MLDFFDLGTIDIEEAERRLRRLFPSLAVSARSRDCGTAAQVCVIVEREPGLCAYEFRAAALHGGVYPSQVRDFGKRILRAAYPNGWAQA